MEICHQGRHFQLFRADYCETMFQGNVPEKKKKMTKSKTDVTATIGLRGEISVFEVL